MPDDLQPIPAPHTQLICIHIIPCYLQELARLVTPTLATMAKPGRVAKAKKQRNDSDEEVEDDDEEEDEDFDAEAEEASAQKKRRNVFVDDAAEEDGDEVCGLSMACMQVIIPHMQQPDRIQGQVSRKQH